MLSMPAVAWSKRVILVVPRLLARVMLPVLLLPILARGVVVLLLLDFSRAARLAMVGAGEEAAVDGDDAAEYVVPAPVPRVESGASRDCIVLVAETSGGFAAGM